MMLASGVAQYEFVGLPDGEQCVCVCADSQAEPAHAEADVQAAD